MILVRQDQCSMHTFLRHDCTCRSFFWRFLTRLAASAAPPPPASVAEAAAAGGAAAAAAAVLPLPLAVESCSTPAADNTHLHLRSFGVEVCMSFSRR